MAIWKPSHPVKQLCCAMGKPCLCQLLHSMRAHRPRFIASMNGCVWTWASRVVLSLARSFAPVLAHHVLALTPLQASPHLSLWDAQISACILTVS